MHLDLSALTERLSRPGPKRVLALDGGGLRGIVSLGYLEAIESLLRERTGRPALVLSDYFDLVGGTSTGALIATLIALGRPVADITQSYIEFAHQAFQLDSHGGLGPLGRLLGNRYEAAPLEAILRSRLGEMALDSAQLRTGLVVVTKRADTASVWPVTNIPTARYYDDWTAESGIVQPGNRHIPLWKLLRASTAAPTYFKSQAIVEAERGAAAEFIDGGISAHNNPALLLLMVASLAGFGLRWPLGANSLLLCSIGTGQVDFTTTGRGTAGFTALDWARVLVPQLVHDSMELVEVLLQWMSASTTARRIDGTLEKVTPCLTGAELLHYLRYNLPLTADGLAEIGLQYPAAEISSLREMSSTASVPQYQAIAARVGTQIQAAHFPQVFDAHV
jgi:predicted acylesterase/phospholipase RssA